MDTTIDQKIKAADHQLEVARNKLRRAHETLIVAWNNREKLVQDKFTETESNESA